MLSSIKDHKRSVWKVKHNLIFKILLYNLILHNILVPSEPIWILGRRESSGQLFWRRDSSKVKFRCDVEVLEYVKDPAEHIPNHYDSDSLSKTNFLIVCATCAAALAVTVVLPWFLMGSS